MLRPAVEVIEPELANPLEPLSDWGDAYRPNVAALIARRTSAGTVQLLLGERRDLRGSWQWPQGGIDPGEAPVAALHREVAEETGLTRIQVQYTFPFKVRYRFPKRLGEKFYPRVGQEQTYFIATIATDETPDLANASSCEFVHLQWRDLATAAAHTVWFKVAVYETVVAHALQVVDQLDLGKPI